MPWNTSDKILWATICFSIGFAYSYVPLTLKFVKSLTVVPDASEVRPKKELRTDAEKAISLHTLKTLSDGYSHEIRASTLKIVANRTIKSSTKSLLLRDLRSTDESKRGHAIQALWLLLYNQALNDRNNAGYFQDLATLTAIVDALVNLLPYHRKLERQDPSTPPDTPPSPIHPAKRPAHEKLLLAILGELLTTPRQPALQNHNYFTNVECALEAGLVTRWLKDYPFPCSLPENLRFNFKKSDVCSLFEGKNWASDDLLMAGIIQIITGTARGNKQLREAGLKASSLIEDLSPGWRRSRTLSELDNDVRMINGESTAGAITPPEPDQLANNAGTDSLSHHRERNSELSLEEERLRRRRREAVVVAEAGVPLRRENILQRQDSNLFDGANGAMFTSDQTLDDEMAQLPGFRALEPTTLDRLQARLAEVRRRANRHHVSNIADLANAESAEIEHVAQETVGPWSAEELQVLGDIMEGRIPQAPWTLHENVSFANGETPPEVRQLLQEEIDGEAGFNEMIRQDVENQSRRQSDTSEHDRE